MSKLSEKHELFSNALKRLKEAIDMYEKKENDILLDGTIQRFEFTVELAWKLMKEYLQEEKFGEFNSPKSVVKQAYSIKLIENGEEWLNMLEDRNLTSHTYNETEASNIYYNIVNKYYDILYDLKTKIGSVI